MLLCNAMRRIPTARGKYLEFQKNAPLISLQNEMGEKWMENYVRTCIAFEHQSSKASSFQIVLHHHLQIL